MFSFFSPNCYFLYVSELPPGKAKYPFSFIPFLFYYLIFSPLSFSSTDAFIFFLLFLDFQHALFFFHARSVWFYFGISLTCIVIMSFLSVFLFFCFLIFRQPDIFNVLSRGRGLVGRTNCVSSSSNGILFTRSPDDWTALLNRQPIEDITFCFFVILLALLSREEAYTFRSLNVLLYSVILIRIAVSLTSRMRLGTWILYFFTFTR